MRFTSLGGLAALLIVGAAVAMPAVGRAQEEGRGEQSPVAGVDRDVAPPGDPRWRPSGAIEAMPHAGASGFDRERLWSGFDDWEPIVAADPSSSYVYQLTTRLDGPRPCNRCAKDSIIFRRSHDGGATWEADRFLFPSQINEFDPQIRVARDGSVYAAFLQSYRPGVTFIRSTDHGTTWTVPVTFTHPHSALAWNDRPSLAISASGHDVFIAFNRSDSWIVTSHDSGKTFGAPQQTSHDHRYYFHSAGTVAPDGSATFTAQAYTQSYHGNVNIDTIHTSDGGMTWQTTQVDVSREPPDCSSVPGCYLGFLGPEAGIAADANGTLLLAYNANLKPRAPERLFARTSTDGVTWTSRAEISGAGSAVTKTFPAVAAGPDAGDFRVVWMDNKTGDWDTWYRRLAGGTWSVPVKLSNRNSGAPYKSPHGFGFPYGDYLGVSVGRGGRAHAIWGAGPSYNGPGGTWYTREGGSS